MSDTFGSYRHLTTAATAVVVCAQPCHLISVVINGGTGGAITIYDDASTNTSGNEVAIIEAIGATNPVTLEYYANLNRGLVVTLAANTDCTFIYF